MKFSLRRRHGVEDGVTLIELVMSVAMVGLIVVPLTGVVFSYFRTTVDIQARMGESHDVQFAAAYWQRDVASIGVRSSTYSTADHSFRLEQSVDVAACPLPPGVTAAATLAWSEYSSLTSTDVAATVKVTYASRSTSGGYELLRVRCNSEPSILLLADNLVEPPMMNCRRPDGSSMPTCTGEGDQVPAIVNLRLRVRDTSGNNTEYSVTLSGQRRQT